MIPARLRRAGDKMPPVFENLHIFFLHLLIFPFLILPGNIENIYNPLIPEKIKTQEIHYVQKDSTRICGNCLFSCREL